MEETGTEGEGTTRGADTVALRDILQLRQGVELHTAVDISRGKTRHGWRLGQALFGAPRHYLFLHGLPGLLLGRVGSPQASGYTDAEAVLLDLGCHNTSGEILKELHQGEKLWGGGR